MLYYHFEKIRKIAGVDKACRESGYGRAFHGFRHCLVSEMKNAGGNNHLCRAITGHSTQRSFDSYGSVSYRSVAEELARVFSPSTESSRLDDVESKIDTIIEILRDRKIIPLDGVKKIDEYL